MNLRPMRFRKNLRSWYLKNRRILPWRKTKDPYHIWVSEVMLQQTRVETVIPYYQKFLQHFPTVKKLAEAKEDQVLAQWQGLGYYRRARHLHQAAKELQSTYRGTLPRHSKELKKLKGFGPYTSAAVASIAFGEAVASVDGNVSRVISRLFTTDKNIESYAQEILDPVHPSDFNQAMMELGATLCLPKIPKCQVCPVSQDCQAKKQKKWHLYPRKKTKKPSKVLWDHVCFLYHRRSDSFVARQRGQDDRWAKMWECPGIESETQHTAPLELKDFLSSHIQFKRELSPLAIFTHKLTHQDHHVHVYATEVKKKEIPSSFGQWIAVKERHNFAMSRLQQKVIYLSLNELLDSSQ